MSHRNILYYDEADNVTCVRDPDLGLTYYEYDLLDRVTSVKNPFGEVTYYEYTPGGQVKQKILGNGAVSYYSYDAARRVSRIEHRASDLTEIATLDYEYDRVGNPTKITREDGSATYYSYDHIYQLTGETQVDSGGGVEYAFEYDYDGAHNRTVKVVDGTPTYYAYNEANQLLTETTGDETTYYHYDGCGNTVAKQEAAGTTYYQYDTENLITRIDFPDGGHGYYSYDADSKRVDQRTADGFREFVYQGPDMLKLQLERDESEETVAHYTMGSGLEAMRRDNASSFYHFNHLGTALALTGADEAVSDTYRHDAWGVLLESTGATVNPHTYVGRERYYRMPNADMYHLGFRELSPEIGRLVQVDPKTASVSIRASSGPIRVRKTWYRHPTSPAPGLVVPFVYAHNQPVSLTDPIGLSPWTCDQCLQLPWGIRHICWMECEPVTELPPGIGNGLIGGYFCTCEEQLDYWKKQADEELRGCQEACDYWEDFQDGNCDYICRRLIGEGPPNPGYRGCIFVCRHYAGGEQELCDAMCHYWYWSHIGYAEAEYWACKRRRGEPWP